MGFPRKAFHLVLFLAVAAAAVCLLFCSRSADDGAARGRGGWRRSGIVVASGAGSRVRLLGGDGRIVPVRGDEDDDAGGGVALRRSPVADTFRVLLGFARNEVGRAGYGGAAPAPAPAPAPSAARVRRRPPAAGSYSRSPLPRPSRIPPVDGTALRKAGSSKARALWIIAAVAVAAGAATVLVALAVVLVRHRLWRRRTSSASGDGVNKVGFDPRVELFYLDTFAPGLPDRAVDSREQDDEYDGRGERRSPPPSDGSPAGSSERCGTEDDDSFHSLSICNSHSSDLQHSDGASETSDRTNTGEVPRTAAFVPPPPLKPPSSPHPAMGFARRVSFSPDVLSSQPPSQKVKSGRKLPTFSSPPPPPPPPPPPAPPHPPPPPPPAVRRLSLHLYSQIPSSSSYPRTKDPAGTSPTEGTPSSSSSANPNLKKFRAETSPSLPPPAPPSFKKGGSPGQPPPPPPPRVQPPFEPAVGKDGSPLPRLKPLHWDKVRATPDRSMVWDKIRSSSFELDEEMIESLFGYNLQSSGRSEEACRSKASSPSKHVLEPKRLQNFTILLKALNATTPDQICEALLRGSGLDAQQLEALAKMVPTREEEERLLSFEGDAGELDPVERFVRDVLSIDFSFSRIEVMLFRETFDDEVAHLRKSFRTVEEACDELRSSRLFLRLLEAVLKTGNRMNVGTTRGGARAFKLDALLKLADVKGTDGKTTLLHFVVQEIVRSEGGATAADVEKEEDCGRATGLELVSGLSTELCHVKTAAGVDLESLAGSVASLSGGRHTLEHLLEHLDGMKPGATRADHFVHSMRSFSSHAAAAIDALQEDERRVAALVREITEYYHGDVSKEEANPLGIFLIVRDFLGMLDRVCREVGNWKGQHSPTMAVPFR